MQPTSSPFPPRLQFINIAPTLKNSLVMIPTCRSSLSTLSMCCGTKRVVHETPTPPERHYRASAFAAQARRIQKSIRAPSPELKCLLSLKGLTNNTYSHYCPCVTCQYVSQFGSASVSAYPPTFFSFVVLSFSNLLLSSALFSVPM